MFKILILTFLLIINSHGGNLLAEEKTVTQNPPAQTYQPGYWQPVARANIKLPIKINLINETDITVAYSVTESQMEPIVIKSHQTITLNNVKPPIYAVIYPDSENSNNSLIDLKYKVQITLDNIIEVTITKAENSSDSHRTFNLQETGAIYVY
jgi:hypothetical protein